MKTPYDTLIRLETREVERLRLDLAAAAETARQHLAQAAELSERQQAEAHLAAGDPLSPSHAWLGLARRRIVASEAAATAAAARLETIREAAAERLARLRSIERLADDARRTALAARESAAQREIEDLQAARRSRRP
jgi:hypothetical protein